MSVLPAFELHRPASVAEALDLISPDDIPYVGGTELLLVMRQGLLRPRSLVSLRNVEGMEAIHIDADEAKIGAAITHHRASTHKELIGKLPVLREVLVQVGNPRVRAAGTLAGNLCFAEPKSDVIPLLIALEGSVELTGPSARRRIPVADFVLGPYTTSREANELLTWIHIPLIGGRRFSYRKFQTMERPTVGVAGVRFENDTSPRTRIVVGAAGMNPVVADGKSIDPEEISERIEPVPDLTGSVEYKRHVTSVFIKRVLRDLDGTDG